MKTKHTPGPWLRRKEWKSDDHKLEIWAKNKNIKPPFCPAAIANVSDNYDEFEANANLIAATPELLEALEYAESLALAWVAYHSTSLTYGNGNPHPNHVEGLAKIKAAIAKAKGETL